jgi:hypothetical protein
MPEAAGRGRVVATARGLAGRGRSLRPLVYAAALLLLSGCVPIGVRVQNMLALWSG